MESISIGNGTKTKTFGLKLPFQALAQPLQVLSETELSLKKHAEFVGDSTTTLEKTRRSILYTAVSSLIEI
jgi:hypothetical protein